MSAPQHRLAETSYETMNDPRQNFGPDYASLLRSPGPAKNGNGGRGKPKRVVVGVGCLMLVLLCFLPVWNTILLLMDGNFVFFIGRTIPLTIILMCITVVLLYAVTVLLFFKYGQQEFQTEQTVMMISTLFVTLLGLFLLLMTLPLFQRTQGMYKDLRTHCGSSPSTARLYEYYQVLLNIRREPACAQKLSVKECTGYADSEPYTGFLEYLEGNLMCSGFCQGSTSTLLASLPVAEPSLPPVAPTSSPQAAEVTGDIGGPIVYPTRPPSLSQESAEFLARPVGLLRRHEEQVTPLGLSEVRTTPAQLASLYPPTLFSDANYQISCDGAMSRDMKYFAQDIAAQIGMQGVLLLAIAVGTGFLKLIGLCRQPSHSDRIK